MTHAKRLFFASALFYLFNGFVSIYAASSHKIIISDNVKSVDRISADLIAPPVLTIKQAEYILRLPQNSIVVSWDIKDAEDDRDGIPVNIFYKLVTNGIDVSDFKISDVTHKSLKLFDLEDGYYTLELFAVDSKGARSTSQNIQIFVLKEDLSQPQLFVIGPRILPEGQTTAFFQARIFNFKNNVSFKWFSLDEKLADLRAEKSSRLKIGRIPKGSYYLKVEASDAEGNNVETPFMIEVDDRSRVNMHPVISAINDSYTANVTDSIFKININALDPDGTIISYHWEKIKGNSGIQMDGISSPELKVRSFREGQYAFLLTVTDDSGAVSTSQYLLDVMASTYVNTNQVKKDPLSEKRPDSTEVAINQNKVINSIDSIQLKSQQIESREEQKKINSNEIKNSILIPESKTVTISDAVNTPIENSMSEEEMIRQKNKLQQQEKDYMGISKFTGGPSNAFLNLLMPGLGHYRVSGPLGGSMRKKSSFLITASFFAATGMATYYKIKANKNYEDYRSFATSIEMQTGTGGVVIGMRSFNPVKVDSLLFIANRSQSNFRTFAYSAIGILSVDFIYTLFKGFANKRAYQFFERRKAGIRYDPFSKTFQPSVQWTLGDRRSINKPVH